MSAKFAPSLNATTSNHTSIFWNENLSFSYAIFRIWYYGLLQAKNKHASARLKCIMKIKYYYFHYTNVHFVQGRKFKFELRYLLKNVDDLRI